MIPRGISKQTVNFPAVIFKMAVIQLHCWSFFLKFSNSSQMTILFIISKVVYDGNEEFNTIFKKIRLQTAVISMQNDVNTYLSNVAGQTAIEINNV